MKFKMKTMKPTFKTFPQFPDLARTLLAAVAVLALSAAHTFAADVNATYTNSAEVPVKSNGFTALGKTVNLTLNFAPNPGTELMVVRNTGPGIIRGNFSNLAQGQIVTLSYGGVTYNFVANYYGGRGNDLVLLWTAEESLPAAILKKLDSQIVLALKQNRRQAPFDKPTSLQPDIPIRDATGRVLVDMEGSVSQGLLDQVAFAGGQVINGSETATTFRALVPLLQLENLASRSDVKSISPARPTITSQVKASP